MFKRWHYLIIVITLLISSLYLLKPISDPDFFWHIATGRWIVENKAIPKDDPFSYTTPNIETQRQRIILTSYWLGQVLYYILYSIMGWSGIHLLRFIITFIMAYFIMRLIEGDIWLKSALTLLCIVLIIHNYPLERPQVFSFMFFTIMLYIFEKIRRYGGENKDTIIACLIMLIWANMHGGFILGQALGMVYLLTGLGFLIPYVKGIEKERWMRLYKTSIFVILCGFINPNTYTVWVELIKTPSYMTQTIVEYQDTLTAFKRTLEWTLPCYWLLLIFAILYGLWRLIKKDIDLVNYVLLSGLGYFSFNNLRYVPFFIIWSIPFISGFINSNRYIRTGGVVISLLLSLTIFVRYEIYKNIDNIRFFSQGIYITSYYPHKAVNFIIENRLKGNMYNYYDFGGYLIWRFYPEKKVFIDGRQLHGYVYSQSNMLDQAQTEPRIMGKEFYKAVLDSYGINYILIPVYNISGFPIPLFKVLIDDPEWVPVFNKDNSLIFVRNVRDNYGVIYKYSIPRDYLISDIIEKIDNSLRGSAGHMAALFYSLKGDLLARQLRFDEAKKAYEEALKINPLNEDLKERIRLIELGTRSPGR